MPEEKNRINIENQEAGRDIVNVAGNYIIQHPITHEPVYISSIQSVLRKGETTEGDFFKKEPEWVDYEQSFIVERKEVDEIIKKLENNNIQLVLGAPASGKSIILKNVGYKLANNNKNVYVVELKKHPIDEIKQLFEKIPKIDDDNPIFIIDDAHLNLSECERLIRNFKGRGKGKLIIGSRKIKEIIEGDPTESSEFEHLSKTAILIQTEDVTEEMLKTFLIRQHNLNEVGIRKASANLKNFKKDLWYFSWALKVFDSGNYSVDENKIFKNIKKKIENINAENVFLPLSVFFRYEIQIERKFLEKELGIEESIIEDLIGLQEIVEIEEIRKPIMLSLHHSSIADLYFRTYQNYPSFGDEIKEKILNQKDDEALEYCLFYRYLTTTDSRNIVDVVISICIDFGFGRQLLKSLLENDNIQKSIINGIDEEEDIEKIGRCAEIFALTSKEVAMKLATSIDINALSSKINKEEDIEKIGWCIWDIGLASKEVGLKLADSLDINALSLKINKEDDIKKVVGCVSNIALVSKEVAMKLVDSFSAKINKEEDIKKVGLCVYRIAWENKIAMKLMGSIDIGALSAKINKEEDIKKVGSCVSSIARVSEEAATEIINRLNPKLREELQKRMQELNPSFGTPSKLSCLVI